MGSQGGETLRVDSTENYKLQWSRSPYPVLHLGGLAHWGQSPSVSVRHYNFQLYHITSSCTLQPKVMSHPCVIWDRH